MFASLLVPLDQSPVAELALPFAVAIAQRAKRALALVAVHHSYVFDDPHASNAWALKMDSGIAPSKIYGEYIDRGLDHEFGRCIL